MTDKKTFEVARETLKQLTVRKLPPTPLNYQRIYCELAGLPIEPPFPVDRLRDIAMALPTKTPGQQKQRGLLESSINHLNWDGVKNALMAYGGFTPTGNTNFAPFPDSGPAPLAREPLLREPLLAPSPVSAPALVKSPALLNTPCPRLATTTTDFKNKRMR